MISIIIGKNIPEAKSPQEPSAEMILKFAPSDSYEKISEFVNYSGGEIIKEEKESGLIFVKFYNKITSDELQLSRLIESAETINPVASKIKTKISEKVKEKAASNDRVNVIINFSDPVPVNSKKDLRKFAVGYFQDEVLDSLSDGDFKLKDKFKYTPAVSGFVTKKGLSELENNPLVESVRLVQQTQITSTESVPLVKADVVHVTPYELTGKAVSIAVIDTGVDIDHTDFTHDNSIIDEKCFTSDIYDDQNELISASDCEGGNPYEGDIAEDRNGHGTNVAGIITAPGGIAPDSNIIPIRVANNEGIGSDVDWNNALNWIIDNQQNLSVAVVNISMEMRNPDGTGLFFDDHTSCDAAFPDLYNTISQLTAQGVVVFAGTGNSGSRNGISAPACLSNVIAVGATYDDNLGREPDEGTFADPYPGSGHVDSRWADCYDLTTNTSKITCFSNTSTNLSNIIMAPGARLTSTGLGGGLSEYSGTSQSTPIAAGVGALIIQLDGSLTTSEVLSTLKNTGTPVFTKQNDQFSLIDANQAVESVIPVECQNVTEIPVVECITLKSLYETTSGKNWSNNSNWLQNNQPCTWYGVTCNSGHIEVIVLNNNNLVGILPDELQNLKHLITLNLGSNTLNGSIPIALYNISSLENLSLNQNNLSGLIPERVEGLVSLSSLNLSENQLSGSLPPNLGNIYTLAALDLSKNQFSGNIPTELGNLSNLIELDLSKNLLSGEIPFGISSLASGNLLDLYLGNNQLEGEVHNIICNNVPLTLGLNYNMLTDVDSSCGYHTSWLQTQTVSPAGFQVDTSTQDSITFSWTVIPYAGDTGYYELAYSTSQSGNFLSIAQTDDKAQNILTINDLPPDATYYFKIRTSTLAHGEQQSNLTSKWEGIIPGSTSGTTACAGVSEIPETECLALESLYSTTNGNSWKNNSGWLQNNTPCSWYGVTCVWNHVYRLELANNNLAGLLPFELNHLQNLYILDLSLNHLSGSIPVELGTLFNLTELNLQSNQLSGTIPMQIGNISTLRYLNFFNNQLAGTIPVELAYLTNLLELELGLNNLNGNLPPELGGMNNLHYLHVGSNYLEGSIPATLCSIPGSLIAYFFDNMFTDSDPCIYNLHPAWDKTQTVPPKNITVNSNQDNSLTISWTPILYQSGGGNYQVKYAFNPGGPYNDIACQSIDKTESTCKTNVLTTSIPYYFVVQTYSKGLYVGSKSMLSKYSDEVSIVIAPALNIEILEPGGLINVADQNTKITWLDGGTNINSTLSLYYDIDNIGEDGTVIVSSIDVEDEEDQYIWDTSGIPEGDYYIYGIVDDGINPYVSDYSEGSVTIDHSVKDFCSGVTSIPVSECEALGILYQSTDGDNWSNNSGWLQDGDPCNWHGLTCSGNNIISINLNNNLLNGTIPSDLSNLTLLQQLDLSYNNLKGNIPTELANLINLKSLILFHNHITGDIPFQLGGLTNLENLILGENKLEGSIPTQIGSLINLSNLNLSGNRLSGSIPNELSALTKLNSLALSKNQLDGNIPYWIGDFNVLWNLVLSFNNFEGNLPAELGNLSTLYTLELSNNALSGSIPMELGYLSTTLYRLDLSNNLLSGSIPSELGNLNNLAYLYLNNNQLDGSIPLEIGNLSNLEELLLKHNKLEGDIPPNLGSLNSLVELDISSNQLEGNITADICNIASLTAVDFGYNMIESADTCVDILDLDWSQTQTIPPTNITVNINTDNSLTFYWSVIPYQSDEGFYRVNYSYNQGDDYYGIGCETNNKTGTSCTTGILNVDTPYYFVLQTFTQGNPYQISHFDYSENYYDLWSKYSNEIPITIPYTPKIEIQEPDINGRIADRDFLIVWMDEDTGYNGDISLYYDIDKSGEDGTLIVGGISEDDEVDNYLWDTLAMPEGNYYIYGILDDGVNPLGIDYSEGTITIDHAASNFCAGVTSIPISECEALGDLYKSTNGDGWQNNTGWLQDIDPCTWYGVVCNLNSVGMLNLSANLLSGHIPLSIHNLTNLTILSLHSNLFNENIPGEIGSLNNLLYIDLSNNQLGENIPIEIGNLGNLEYIDLSSNQLIGNVPYQFGNLINLNQLILGDNQLDGTFPEEIANLTSLTTLKVEMNHLDGNIFEVVKNLSNLQEIYLYTNQFSGNIPYEISNLNVLTALRVHNNKLGGEIPSGICNIPGLSDVVLSTNMFTDSDPCIDTIDPDWRDTQTVPPSDIRISSISIDNKVNLTWTPIIYQGDGGYYKVSYSTIKGGPYENFACQTNNKTENTCTTERLLADTQYYFVIQTFTPPHSVQQNELWSEYSEEVSAIITPNVDSLITAINVANTSGEPTNIFLYPNFYYSLEQVNNTTNGNTGLPVITGDVTIIGGNAIIEREVIKENIPNMRIFNVDVGGKLILKDVKVRHGSLDSESGGAIRNEGELVLDNVELSQNIANQGGAIYNFGQVTITNSTLEYNMAFGPGAGIENTASGTVNISDSILHGNISGSGGGGINNLGILTANTVQISENLGASGGGVSNGGSANLSAIELKNNTTIDPNQTNNPATGICDHDDPYKGGGICNYGTLTIADSIIQSNASIDTAGGIYNDSTAVSVTINNSCILSNAATKNDAITNYSTDSLDATNNWWGFQSGPTPTTIIEGNVNTSPPLSNPILGCPSGMLHDEIIDVKSLQTLPYEDNEYIDTSLQPLGDLTPSCGTGITKGIYYQITDDQELVGNVIGRARIGGIIGRARIGGVIGRARIGGVIGRARIGGIIGKDKYRFNVSGEDFGPVVALFTENELNVMEEKSCETGLNNLTQLDVSLNPGVKHYMVIGFTDTDDGTLEFKSESLNNPLPVEVTDYSLTQTGIPNEYYLNVEVLNVRDYDLNNINFRLYVDPEDTVYNSTDKAAVTSDTAVIVSIPQGAAETINNQLSIQFTGNYVPGNPVKLYLEVSEEITTGSYTRTAVSTLPLVVPPKLKFEFWDFDEEQEITSLPLFPPVDDPRYLDDELTGLEEYAIRWVEDIDFPFNEYYSLTHDKGGELSEQFYDRMVGRLKGYFKAEYSGTYEFYLTVEGGTRLMIGGNTVIDDTGVRKMENGSVIGSLALDAGWHEIEIQYFDDLGGNGLKLEYKNPVMNTPEIIPPYLFTNKLFPQIQVTEPDGLSDIADNSYVIRWADEDPSNNSTITLFYDTDNNGADGLQITDCDPVYGQEETDNCTWDTSAVPEGDYYIYGTINDGVNPQVTDYSEWPVTVTHAVTNFCASVSTIPANECEALGALYNYTKGTTWINNSGWLQNNDPCTWFGITCSLGSVSMVHLSGNQLIGSIPPELGNLNNLTSMSLHSNYLSGYIPGQVGSLSGLWYLSLGSNQLTGNIPAELGNLSNLEYLDLSYNLLDGNIPPELGYMSNLASLLLNNNQLTGNIPGQLGSISSLYKLVLNDNQLNGPIPSELSSLTGLIELKVNKNKLSGSIPSIIGDLTNLQRLYLNVNQFDGNLPVELGNLRFLEKLYLENNQLEGEIPVEICSMFALRAVDFGYNMFSDSNICVDTIDLDWKDTQTVPPTNISSGLITTGIIELNWAPVFYQSDGGYYQVSYSETAGEPYEYTGCTTNDKTGNGCITTGLQSNTMYYFAVQTFTPSHGDQQNDLLSEYSSEISISTLSVPPTITLVQPDGVDDLADTSYTITWTDDDPDNDALIDLFYDSDNTGEDGTMITSGISEDDPADSYIWDTSVVIGGDYYIYGIIDDGTNPQVIDYSDVTVTINHAPSITITEPDGINDVGDTVYTITWNDGDPEDNAAISLYYDTDNIGEDGVLITSGISEDDPVNSYNWDMSAISGGDYYIYGIITDGTNPQASDYSEGPVTINHSPSIQILEPDGSGDLAEDNFTITWTDSDDEDDAAITLFYDTNNSGADGMQITDCGPISEDSSTDSCTWDTSAITEGAYYIYAIINDQINPPVIAYSYYPVLVNRQGMCPTSLCNGDFESTVPLEYWTSGNGINQVSTDVVQDGINAYYTEHVYDNTQNPRWSGIWQNIMIESAQTYGLTGFYQSDNAAQGHVKISWKDISGILLQVDYPVTNINGTSSNWIEFSKLVIAPAGAFTAEIRIWHGVNSSAQNVLGSKLWIDSLVFDVATTACGTLCNESFEHGILYWIQSGVVGSHTIEQTGVHEGLKTLKSEQLYTTEDETKWAGITQFAQVKEGTNYRLRSWFKTENAANGHIRIRWRDDSGSLINTQYPVTGIGGTNPSWFSREVNITAPATATRAEISIWHGVTSENVTGSTLWIDDITLICESLCNGGFEDGSVHWETNGKNEGDIIKTDVYEGSSAIKIVQRLDSSDISQWAGISQRTLVTEHGIYDLSFWLKKENAVQGHVKIKWRDSNDQLISQQFPIGGINGTDLSWTQTGTTLVAPENAETIEIFIWHGVNGTNNNATGSTLYIDDVKLVQTSINSQPTDITLSNENADENQLPGTLVGTFGTADPNIGDTHIYEFAIGSGDTDNNSFIIINDELQTNEVFEYEVKDNYSIRVRSTDQYGLWFEKIFTININDINEAPTDIILSNDNVDENQIVGVIVGTFDTADPDVGNTHSYALIAGDGDGDNNSFVIINNELQTNETVDYETKNNYSIRIKTTDSGTNPPNLTFEKIFTISVNNVNDAPTDITLSNYTVDENQSIGMVVGTFTTADQDSSDTHTYEFVAGAGDTDNSSFSIVNDELASNEIFDHESKDTYSIRIRTTDSGVNPPNLTFEKAFTINVNDVNESPTDITLSNGYVDENQADGTVVGTFSAADPDDGDVHAYTLVAGDGDGDNGSFVIINAELQTNESFDYEVKDNYSIRVRSTDPHSLWVEKTFTISINDINETPTDLSLSNDTLDENQPVGTSIGTFSTSDPDVGDTFTYTLVSGDGDADNGSFTVVNNELQTNEVFDYETKSSYSIRIRATDDGTNPDNLTFEKSFTIGVNNINEPPTITIIEPDGTDDRADASYNITWTDEDSEDNASITLFYDTDTVGQDGIRIPDCDPITANDETDFCIWDTSSIAEGNYYIYGIIDDGFNSTVVDYSDGTVVVSHIPLNTYAATYGESDVDFLYSLNLTSDGGYIAAGYTRSYTYPDSNAQIAKFDQNGAIKWQKRYTNGENSRFSSIEQTIDGGYIAAGSNRFPSNTYDDAWIVKLDPEGSIEWEKLYGGSQSDYVVKAMQTSDNGYIVGISTTSYGAGNGDFMVLKLGTNGEIVWQKTYGGTQQEYLTDMEISEDGGYVLCGKTVSGPGNFDYWLVKLDVNGNLEWEKKYGGGSDDEGVSVEKTMEGGYIMSGYTESYGGKPNFWLIKVDDTGSIIWQNYYSVGNKYMFDPYVELANDGGYLMAGKTVNTNYDSTTEDLLAVKVDIDGNIEWDKAYSGPQADFIAGNSSIMQMSNGSYLLSGGTKSFGAGDWDSLMLSIDSTGNIQSCSICQDVTVSQAATSSSYNNSNPTVSDVIVENKSIITQTYLTNYTGNYECGTSVNNYPLDITLSSYNVDENQPVGTVIGTLSTTDPDIPDIHTYELAAGPGDTDNSSLSILNDELLTNEVFDYEVKNTYYIRVRSTDSGNAKFEKAFTITINEDLNPPKFNWAISNGTSGNEYITSSGVDDISNLYILGYLNNTLTLEAGKPNEITLSGPAQEIFVAKYSPTGTLLWAKSTGGPDIDISDDMHVDGAGNTYITGRFHSTSTFGSGEANETILTSTGDRDIYVAKYDTNGSLVWAKRAGGTSYDEGHGIYTDSSGNVYATGYFFESATFGSGEPNQTTITGVQWEMWVAKFNNDGTLAWAKSGGGSSDDKGKDVETNSSGYVYNTGYFRNTATFGSGEPNQTTLTGSNYSMFMAKYNNSDGTLVWAKEISAIDIEAGNSVKIDSMDNIYLAESFSGSITLGSGEPNETTLTSVGGRDGFIAKYNSDGGLIWARSEGGPNNDWLGNMDFDTSGNLYAVGGFNTNITIGLGQPNETTLNGPDGEFFFVKYSPDGDLKWARADTGIGGSWAANISLDPLDNVYIAGGYDGDITFGPGEPSETTINSIGSSDIYAAKYLTGPNEAPTDIILSNDNVHENRPAGTLVGILTSEDTNTNDIHTYELTAGTGDTDNASFTILNNELKTNEEFNYSVKNSYSIRVKSTDTTGGSFEKVFTISILQHSAQPEFNWVTTSGTTGNEYIMGSGVDYYSNLYVAGYFNGTIILGTGEPNETTLSGSDQGILLAKYNSDGNLLWAKSAGGTGEDIPNVMYVDTAGNSYITGTFQSNCTFGYGETNETTLNSAGDRDIFVAKYDTNGLLTWAKRAGSSTAEGGHGIYADGFGNVYTTGFFYESTTFGSGEINETTVSGQNWEMWVAKFNNDGTLAWAKSGGSNMEDNGLDIKLDSNGYVYNVGYFHGSSAIFGQGEPNQTILSGTQFSIYVAKYNNNDGTLVWAKKLGSNVLETGDSIQIGPDDNIYVADGFYETITFGEGEPNETTLTSSGEWDGFITKYDTNGNLIWARSEGGPNDDRLGKMAIDTSGNLYVSGWFNITATIGAGQPNETILTGPGAEFFFTKYSSSGNLEWARTDTGYGDIGAHNISLDPLNNIYIAGVYDGDVTFGPGEPNETTINSIGNTDIYAAKYLAAAPNLSPGITLIEPDGTDDTASLDYTITWTDNDPDNDAQIKLYYDTNNTGEDGLQITDCDPISEDNISDSCTWDTSSVPQGDYYIYATINDHINSQEVDYSDGSVSVVHSTLLEEDWDPSGIDGGLWKSYGSPAPAAYSGQGVGGTYAVNPNGDGSYDSGLISYTPIDITNGAILEFQAYAQASAGTSHSNIMVGLSTCTPADDNINCRNYLAYIYPSAEDNLVRYASIYGTGTETWSPLNNAWHKYSFVINTNGLIDFYRNDTLIYSTTTPVDFNTYSTLYLDVRGRSLSSSWYIDDLVIENITPDIVFEEDWDPSGIDGGLWKSYGSPAPAAYSGQGVGGTYAVNPNGDGSYDSGLISYTPIDITNGAILEFQAYAQASAGTSHSNIMVGLSTCTPADDNINCRNYLAYIYPSAEDNLVRYASIYGTGTETWSPLNNAWHKYSFVINTNGLIDFYRNDTLIYSTTTPVDFNTYSTLYLDVRGRSLSSSWYIDDLVVKN